MMRVAMLRARSEWRRRWGSLLALTLLMAIIGAVVLTTVAGARRTRSAVARATVSDRLPNAFVMLNAGLPSKSEAIGRLPEVEADAPLGAMVVFWDKGYAGAFAPIDERLGNDVLRAQILRGRRPDPNNALEMALPENAARRYHLDVGSDFELAAPSPAQVHCFDDPESESDPKCAAVNELFRDGGLDLAKLEGPHMQMRVVGVSRSLLDIGTGSDEITLNILTPAFFKQYHDDLEWNPATMVRYRPGVTDQQFEDALFRAVPRSEVADFGTFTSGFDSLLSTTGALANGLLAFALVVALAGLIAIIQALARQVTLGRDERSVLLALGLTRRGRLMDAVGPLVPVAIVSATVAMLGAWAASMLMPIGLARRIESDTGFDFDARVLLGGCIVLVSLVLATATVTALLVTRRRTRRHRPAAATLPLVPGTVPATVGVRFATESGRGGRSVPVRSALGGVALGVAGVVGVAVLGGSLAQLVDEPSRQGWGWDVAVTGERRGEQASDTRTTRAAAARHAARLAADPDVVGVVQAWMGFQPRVEKRTVTGYAQRFFEGDHGFVIVSGRAPQAADEVALGAKTLRRAATGIGRTITIDSKPMRVVGTALFPGTNDGYRLADGALFSDDGARALGLEKRTDTWFASFGVQLRQGANRKVALARLAKLNSGETPEVSLKHAEVEQLEQLDRLPVVLAGFLLLIALLAVAHALVLTVRRRAPDLAVLRTLGCSPSQTRRIVSWQATALAAVGALIGIPIGMLLGRVVWVRIADAYGIANDPAWPWIVIAVAVPVAVALSNAIAWWPGRRAARVRPAQVLRTE